MCFRLFLLPQYCSALIEQSLLLNRRRNDRERVLKEMNFSDDASLDSSSTDAMRKQREQIVPKIYVCATMWHETEDEMTQLLKSVFRSVVSASTYHAQLFLAFECSKMMQFPFLSQLG